MLKKFLVGIGIGIIILGGIYGYFLYIGNPNLLGDWMQTHRRHSSIFFVSIPLLYIFNGEKKLYRFLSFVIVLINLFIVGDIFFKNNIGLNSQQFGILFILILLSLGIMYIQHKIRYLLITIVGTGILIILLTGILPMYENMPNMDDFIVSQKQKIINQGANDGIITIKNEIGSKEIIIKELLVNNINLSQKTQINFASKTTSDLEKIFIDLGSSIFINIHQQSIITLEQSGDVFIIEILQGNITYYVPQILSGTLNILGTYTGNKIQKTENTIWEFLIKDFEQQKKDFFINQLGGSMILNPTIDKIIRFFINTLYTISPKTYQNNLSNYNNIQLYLGNSTIEDTQVFTGENIRSMIDDMMSQAKKGREETMFLKFFFK